MNNTIDIICPLYNAENYVSIIHNFICMQKDVEINNINFIITRGKDNTESVVSKMKKDDKKVKYSVIDKDDFSHSLIREKVAMKSKSDILVFITQDILVEDDMWLKNLVEPIIQGEAEATYARQITKFNNMEKYTREFNYPEKSFIKTKEDIPQMGLKTFFNSDACAAVKTSIFHNLNGYDGIDMPVNEDMYFAYKLIMNGYKIKYTAESVVFHSHRLTLKELYNRYKEIGKFFKQNVYIDQYGTIKSGSSMAKYVLKRILQEGRIILLIRFPFDMAARLLGMRAGKKINGK